MRDVSKSLGINLQSIESLRPCSSKGSQLKPVVILEFLAILCVVERGL